jgi:hypothetical protein
LPAHIKVSLYERTAEAAAAAAAAAHAAAAAARQKKLDEAFAAAEKRRREFLAEIVEDPKTAKVKAQRDEAEIMTAAAMAAAAVRPAPQLVAEAKFCVTGGSYDIHATIRTVINA